VFASERQSEGGGAVIWVFYVAISALALCVVGLIDTVAKIRRLNKQIDELGRELNDET
jgi:thiol:disulfide interchange protein